MVRKEKRDGSRLSGVGRRGGGGRGVKGKVGKVGDKEEGQGRADIRQESKDGWKRGTNREK